MTFRPLSIALALVLATACGSRPDEPAGNAAPAITVATAAAQALDLPERLEAGGIVSAGETATIAARITAAVASVRVRAGDRVRNGDVLVTLDSRDAAAQARAAAADVQGAEQALLQARSEQAAASAEHRLAEAWQGRIATLQARNSATAQEKDEADARLAAASARVAATAAAVEGATARVAAARAAADAAGVNESFTVIRAPFAGTVTARLVDPGALASPGLPLLRLDADGGRQVEVRIDEARLGYLSPGIRVAVTVESPERRDVEGTVGEVARAATPDGRTFIVKVRLPADVAPRTGTFARVRFQGEPHRAIVVPATAIRRQGQVTSVFAVQDGVARIRLVQAGGGSDNARVEVVSGLEAGEPVIVNPPAGLVDGRRVSVAAAGGGR